MIDSTIVRVHQQAAAQKKQAGDVCIGRTPGGLTTKLRDPDQFRAPTRLPLRRGVQGRCCQISIS
jgi:hypothetical protein